jgi:hypothetical protein
MFIVQLLFLLMVGILPTSIIGLLYGKQYQSKIQLALSSTRLSAGGQVPMVPYRPDKARPREYMWMDIYNALGREITYIICIPLFR